MTVFATKLLQAGLVSTRDAHTLSDLEFDYRLRLTDRSYKLIELPLPDAQTDEDRQSIVSEILDIIRFAKRKVTYASHARTYISFASAEVYRSVTLNWLVGIQPLLAMYLNAEQLRVITASSSCLHTRNMSQ